MAPAAKAEARAQARASTVDLCRQYPDLAVFVRVNPPGTEWFAGDVVEGLAAELDRRGGAQAGERRPG